MNFPNESRQYRGARDKLPPGGEVPEDYVFEGESGPVRLSQLFDKGKLLKIGVRARFPESSRRLWEIGL